MRGMVAVRALCYGGDDDFDWAEWVIVDGGTLLLLFALNKQGPPLSPPVMCGVDAVLVVSVGTCVKQNSDVGRRRWNTEDVSERGNIMT